MYSTRLRGGGGRTVRALSDAVINKQDDGESLCRRRNRPPQQIEDESMTTDTEALIDSIDNYIEFAEKTKRFADVGFYSRVKQALDAQAETIAGLRAELQEMKCSRDDNASALAYQTMQNATLRQQLRAAEARAVQWQPIETAPRDGTVILLADMRGRVANGEFGNYKVWSWPYVMVEPTHWMPLPASPQGSESK